MTHSNGSSIKTPVQPAPDSTMSEKRRHLAALSSEIAKSYQTLGGVNHPEGNNLPSREHVIAILKDILTLCFPGYFGTEPIQKQNVSFFVDALVDAVYIHLREQITRSLIHERTLRHTPVDGCGEEADRVTLELLEAIPRIRALLMGDVEAAYDGDPAAKSHDEIILSYPCVEAIATYRIAHELYLRSVPLIPRIMSEYAHSRTGIDIHPGAVIDSHFFIDHGTGVVIGETCDIASRVKLYQGVTLGALSFHKDEQGNIIRGRKRHPTIEEDVVIYANATILGGDTVVGAGSIIGASVSLNKSVPANTIVTIEKPSLRFREK